MPLQCAKSTGDQGVALVLLAERRRDAKMAKLAGRQIEAAFATSRDGGNALWLPNLKRNRRRPARLPKNSTSTEESTRRIASIYPSRTVLGTPNRDG